MGQMFRGALSALAGILLCMVFFSSLSAQQSKLQTNSAGDNIIEPATNKVRLGLLLPTANFLLPARDPTTS
jgi:hypothetical protein